eukprot:scaffold2001_cov376-Prasinococcus_capsulatus_cf.AAC.3
MPAHACRAVDVPRCCPGIMSLGLRNGHLFNRHGPKASSRRIFTKASKTRAQARAASNEQRIDLPEQEQGVLRRSLLLSTAATGCRYAANHPAQDSTVGVGAWAIATGAARAEESQLEKYNNDSGFSLLVPADWEKGEADFGSSGQKQLYAFYDPSVSGKGHACPAFLSGTRRLLRGMSPANSTWLMQNPEVNANVTVSFVSPNYTKMGSFGSDYDFGYRLVGSLDRSYVDPNDLKAELLDTADKKGVYQVDYTLELPGEYNRHLLQAVTIGFDGKYNRMYTLTLTSPAGDWKTNKKLFK